MVFLVDGENRVISVTRIRPRNIAYLGSNDRDLHAEPLADQRVTRSAVSRSSGRSSSAISSYCG